MKRLINHVRNQPDHVRELAAGVCTAVVVLVIGAIWYHSFQKNVYALLNPAPATAGAAPAVAGAPSNSSPSSLFSAIGAAFGDAKAQIGSIFSGHGQTPASSSASAPLASQAPVHPLPLSEGQ